MHSDVVIEKISIKNFRSHQNLTIESSETNIVLFGENGSGKTNILEAISLFSPGRGMRSAKHDEILNTKVKDNSFEIRMLLKYSHGTVNLHKKFINSEKKESYYLVDDERVNSNELLNYLRIIWITPSMEKVMLQSNTEKRNFFDRLIFNIEQKHLKNQRKLSELLKERLALIQNESQREDWINIVENKIALLTYEVIQDRNRVISLINEKLKSISQSFSSCKIEFKYIKEIKSFLVSKDYFIKEYKNILKSKRFIDAEIGTTSINANKIHISIWKNDNIKLEAKNCSTGEQKLMLIAIIISVAKLIKENDSGKAPIILIDEAMAHLDDRHKEQLLAELKEINSQVWYSGVSKELFSGINNQTVFFEVKNHI